MFWLLFLKYSIYPSLFPVISNGMYLNCLHCHWYHHSSPDLSFFFLSVIYLNLSHVPYFLLQFVICTLLHVCACEHMCVEAITQSWVPILMVHPFTLFFIGTWGSPFRPDWLFKKPQGPTFFCLLSTGFTNMSRHHSWSFTWVLGINRPSCL